MTVSKNSALDQAVHVVETRRGLVVGFDEQTATDSPCVVLSKSNPKFSKPARILMVLHGQDAVEFMSWRENFICELADCIDEYTNLKKQNEFLRAQIQRDEKPVDPISAISNILDAENVRIRAEITGLHLENQALRDELRWFVDQVDKGFIHSKRTYNRFKALLATGSDNNESAS